MENIGRASFTGYSKYINIRNFFVKDRVDKRVIEVKYYTNHLMIADYFIKPLQERNVQNVL